MGWNELYAFVNGGIIGSPGLRDPDAPCEDYEPENAVVASDCCGDGHYLCVEDCKRFTADEGGVK